MGGGLLRKKTQLNRNSVSWESRRKEMGQNQDSLVFNNKFNNQLKLLELVKPDSNISRKKGSVISKKVSQIIFTLGAWKIVHGQGSCLALA